MKSLELRNYENNHMPNQFSLRDLLKLIGIAAGTSALPLSSWATNEKGNVPFYPAILCIKN